MKKFFTLLFAVGILTLAQAQPGYGDNRQTFPRTNQQNDDQRDYNDGYSKERDVVINNNPYDRNGRYNDNNSFYDRDRDMQIDRINREYEFKIQRVKRNFFMSWFEKQREISFLQEQRQSEISKLYAKYNKRRGHSDDYSCKHKDRW